MKRLYPFRFWMVGAALSALLSSLFYVLTPLYLGYAIDAMIGHDNVDMQTVLRHLLSAGAFYGLQFIFAWLLNLIANKIAVAFVTTLRSEIQQQFNEVPLAYLDSHSHGDLQNHFSLDSELVLDAVYQGLTQLIGGIFIILIATVFMLRLSVMMTLIVYAMVPLVFLTSRIITRKSSALYRQYQKEAAQLNGRAGEFIDMHRLILTYNYQERAIETFDELNDAFNKTGVRAQFLSALVNPTTRVVNNISYLLMGLSGAYAMQHFGLSVGGLTAFISYSMMFSKPFNEFSGVMTQLTSGYTALQRIEALLKADKEHDRPESRDLPGKTVDFEHVSFSYTKEQPLIQDLNLHIEPLSKVAIVGPTGSGKSTLINLLMRFYDVDKGVLRVDDADVSEISRYSVRKTIGMVLQDPWLFAGTIRENLLYGNPLADDAKIHDALRQAGCYGMVMSLDEGLDTFITMGSSNISLGQKQMLTIARALLADAPILILDEATSSLDILTEKHIQQVFSTIMQSHTSFFIAHRLATVIDSDVILVMKSGKLIEQGTHQKLMQQKGFYHELFMSQFSG